MNFEQLKSEWAKEPETENEITTIKHLGQSRHPVEKVQQAMKKEGIMQLIAILALAFAPQFLGVYGTGRIIYYISYIVVVVIGGYYLYGFYKFYRQTGLYSADTRSSLMKIYYELRLNMERYQSFGFLLLPHFIVTIGLFMNATVAGKQLSLWAIPNNLVWILIGVVLMGCIAVVACIVWWTKAVYGKHAAALKVLLDQLEDDDMEVGIPQ